MATSLFYGLLLFVTLAVFVAAQDETGATDIGAEVDIGGATSGATDTGAEDDTGAADTGAEATGGGNSGASSGGALSTVTAPFAKLLDGLKAVLGYIYAPIAKIVYADPETCQMLNISLIGCHSCREGASFDYTCQSTAHRAVGHVTCEVSDVTLNIECDPESTPRSARLVVDRAHIDEECNLRCGYREEKFHLKADLSMVAILGKDKLENARQSIPVIVKNILSLALISNTSIHWAVQLAGAVEGLLPLTML
ncbi:hypothetical protein PRIPAC_81585 [Pristionchus pacificus]|uniref:Uncharacterized protein n=1 Tax=Pristionchus pacificus TaxID=54126 RepID=A0A2A6CMD7_PRIPA|nr:hypothetical protein PRIPAC_81585 [Pristionchus pacificus]|eukprot:PDM79266.1 hypothetical protein PRIPAC_31845 [Pristionchus pacificus]